jgi:hypothetical protein
LQLSSGEIGRVRDIDNNIEMVKALPDQLVGEKSGAGWNEGAD